MYRKQQKEMSFICDDLRSGIKHYKYILGDITPGAGKTGMALIAINKLVKSYVDFFIVVVPRSSLRDQFEEDSLDELFFDGAILRSAENTVNLLRGCSGYITTYQGIVANPELHIKESEGKSYGIIFDECAHLKDNSSWGDVCYPLIENAKVCIMMSGTWESDSGFVKGIKYENGFPVKENTEDTIWINYSRQEALEDGAILPIQATLFSSSGSYEKDGEITEFSEIGFDKSALRSSLSSSAAESMLSKAVEHWIKYKNEIGSYAKFLTIDLDVENARRTKKYLESMGIRAGIAVSEDDGYRSVINDFHSGKIDALCSVGICYEGFSCPPITHEVLLTNIRSKSWINQAVARVQRCYKDKKKGYIFAPDDFYMRSVLSDIQNEISRPSKEKEKQEERNPNPFGSSRKINPLYSKIESYRNISDKVTVSMIENFLRKSISEEIEKYVSVKSNVSINGIDFDTSRLNIKREMLVWKMVKLQINYGRNDSGKIIKKPVDEMSIEEMEKALDIIKRLW
jgi:superfamily II DNA or RNA helicase